MLRTYSQESTAKAELVGPAPSHCFLSEHWKQKTQTGAMAQSVDFFVYKYEDLSSHSQHTQSTRHGGTRL